ncbi:MAG: hypothetical protein A2Z12_04945 [Actinobacteria bacterium RBG_16_68_21]|nr:MAG: hypothetical protein A2Z12_04945 [Actinobacteria bacterium RBG_16_68_21]
MTDNLFDRLADLLRYPGPVNWRLAREIAESIAGPAEPIEPGLVEEYRDLAATATRLVDQASALDAAGTSIIVGVHDRRGWAATNVESVAYLAEPIAERLSSGGAGSPLAMLGPALLGMQVGSVVGFLSQRVLGRFDFGVPAGAATGPTFIVPNIEAFALDHDLDPRQLRLWVALHEVAHQSELAVPWVPERLHMLAHSVADGLEIDPAAIQRRFEALQDPEALQNLMEDPGGIGELFGAAADPEATNGLRALAALIEGYAEHVVEGIAATLVPQAAQIREAADRDRAESTGEGAMPSEIAGLTLGSDDHLIGREFVGEVARRWGSDALARLWEGPDTVPKLGELTDAVGWAARVLL